MSRPDACISQVRPVAAPSSPSWRKVLGVIEETVGFCGERRKRVLSGTCRDEVSGSSGAEF